MLDSEVFKICSNINELILNRQMDTARTEVIKLLDRLNRESKEYSPMVNHFIREVGLFPYIDRNTASWQEQAVFEAYKTDLGGGEKKTLHSAQSRVLKRLLAGDNIALSAPTSFGKSFIIDAFISIRKPDNVVIIVPTIALADETRRRIEHKFSGTYKIITTTDATLRERNILILPQERSFSYIDKLESIDMLIVDEFYKASSSFDDSRSTSLLSAMIELGKIAKQKYYLAPNIHNIKENVFTKGMQFMRLTDFKTVITMVSKVYEKMGPHEDKNDFKAIKLLDILKRHETKTLVYAGSYDNINTISKLLANNMQSKENEFLNSFSDWLKINYGESFSLCNLSKFGIGVHNGRMHRSLSQIQVKLFELRNGLDTIVSTSSIIEGVNTQAEQVVVWSNKNGSRKFDYFTYRNIIGRAGRMLKYFVGKVYLLEEPPAQENTTLDIEFPEDVVEMLDSDNPGVEINDEQNNQIKEFELYMSEALGEEGFNKIKNNSLIKLCKPTQLRFLVSKIKHDSNWPNGFDSLASTNSYNWRNPISDVADLLGNNMKGLMKIAIWKFPQNWHKSIAEIHEELVKDSYEFTQEDLFHAERYMSFNLCSTLNVISILKKIIYPETPDISLFLAKAANAFLPKLVYQLEEYGLPRTISRKIQNSGLIDLENDEMEISDIIGEFKKIGYDRLVESIQGIHQFEKFILKFFYSGIS